MRAMVLTGTGPVEEGDRLALRDVPDPSAGPGQVLVRVLACAVCRTDLHVVEGDLPELKRDVIPGHQIVGTVETVGEGVEAVAAGDRVGVPWLGAVDGTCAYCRAGMENLCDHPTFTGYTVDGGYAELVVAHADFVLRLPDSYGDVEATPLLCAGLIGFRSWRMADARGLEGAARVGLYGFGNSAQLIAQVARGEGQEVYAYTRGDAGQKLALELGAVWSGGGDDVPPVELDAVIVFAPVGPLVPLGLRTVRKGGTVVCAGIHMSPIPEFDYDILWGERAVRSVANLTRRDGHEFMELAARHPIQTRVETFPLERANEALRGQKAGTLAGTAVLVP